MEKLNSVSAEDLQKYKEVLVTGHKKIYHSKCFYGKDINKDKNFILIANVVLNFIADKDIFVFFGVESIIFFIIKAFSSIFGFILITLSINNLKKGRI